MSVCRGGRQRCRVVEKEGECAGGPDHAQPATATVTVKRSRMANVGACVRVRVRVRVALLRRILLLRPVGGGPR